MRNGEAAAGRGWWRGVPRVQPRGEWRAGVREPGGGRRVHRADSKREEEGRLDGLRLVPALEPLLMRCCA